MKKKTHFKAGFTIAEDIETALENIESAPLAGLCQKKGCSAAFFERMSAGGRQKGVLNKAFTLAEVLITLTIIGVIAAITIPVVIANQKDAEITAQFKKAFASLSQAVNQTNMLDFGGSSSCFYTVDSNGNTSMTGADWSGCPDFYKALAENLNIIKTCNGNAKADGCVPDYVRYTEAGGGCSNYSQNRINNHNTVYVLADGKIMILYGNVNDTNNVAPQFYIDINGMKGPNKGGYDLFALSLTKDSSGSLGFRAAGCLPVSAGGRSSEEMMLHAFAGKE